MDIGISYESKVIPCYVRNKKMIEFLKNLVGGFWNEKFEGSSKLF